MIGQQTSRFILTLVFICFLFSVHSVYSLSYKLRTVASTTETIKQIVGGTNNIYAIFSDGVGVYDKSQYGTQNSVITMNSLSLGPTDLRYVSFHGVVDGQDIMSAASGPTNSAQLYSFNITGVSLSSSAITIGAPQEIYGLRGKGFSLGQNFFYFSRSGSIEQGSADSVSSTLETVAGALDLDSTSSNVSVQ